MNKVWGQLLPIPFQQGGPFVWSPRRIHLRESGLGSRRWGQRGMPDQAGLHSHSKKCCPFPWMRKDNIGRGFDLIYILIISTYYIVNRWNRQNRHKETSQEATEITMWEITVAWNSVIVAKVVRNGRILHLFWGRTKDMSDRLDAGYERQARPHIFQTEQLEG